MGLADCLTGLLESVASVDELQREVVGTLNTIFYDEEGTLIELAEIIEELVGHAVRSRANDDSHDVVDAQCLFVEYLKTVERVIGISIGLEVGQILHVGVFAGEEALAFLQLLADGVATVAVGGIKRSVVAEDAASCGNTAVAIGAGEACIHRNLLDAEGETAANPGAIIAIIGCIHFI